MNPRQILAWQDVVQARANYQELRKQEGVAIQNVISAADWLAAQVQFLQDCFQ